MPLSPIVIVIFCGATEIDEIYKSREPPIGKNEASVNVSGAITAAAFVVLTSVAESANGYRESDCSSRNSGYKIRAPDIIAP